MSGVLDLEYLRTPARQAGVLDETEHRPWPLPQRSWTMAQTWDDLLFAHWPVEPEMLRDRVPSGVELDLFDGRAWLGITPFRVNGLRLRGTLPLPLVSSFLEVNVRTYVTAEGKPGIWFFSLDAESTFAVEAARRGYRLPYFRARMSTVPVGSQIEYTSRRADPRGHLAELSATYGPAGDVFTAEPGSLEHFLAERYCLYAADGDGLLYRGEIHHPPWPLQPAEADVRVNTMPPPGIELPEEQPLTHFARRLDVVLWSLEPVGT